MGWTFACRGLIVGLLLAAFPLSASAQLPSEGDEEVARQRQIVERFAAVLERNPRRGTALDKIYGFHVENGSIEGSIAFMGKP